MRTHGPYRVCVRQHAEQAVATGMCGLKHTVLRSGAGGEHPDQEAAFGQRLGHLFTARTAIRRHQRRGQKAESRMSVYLRETLPSKTKHSVQ